MRQGTLSGRLAGWQHAVIREILACMLRIYSHRPTERACLGSASSVLCPFPASFLPRLLRSFLSFSRSASLSLALPSRSRESPAMRSRC